VAPPAPVPGAPVAGTPATGTPVSAPVPGGGLSDSDPGPLAASGQLLSFDRFDSKDPFVQQAIAPVAPPAAPPPAAKPPPPPAPAPKPVAPKPTSARISVNGTTELVGVSGGFPQEDPVFVLVSLTKTTAKVGIAGGSLSTGTATLTLRLGKKVTLMNTADGTRYVLLLVSVGDAS